nr:reverse transcriptase domain-containing protein [Tanacetum cinerariifolium]
MFNSTLIGAARVWFDELPSESIDGYKDMKTAFLSYFMQQKKYVKDPAEIHNIKQRDGETLEYFMERFKIETGRMKGAPEFMRISGFMHGINNPELTKRLNEHVPRTMEEMMIATTAFIRGEAATANKQKGHISLLIPAECASVDTSSVTPGEKKAHPANLTVPLHPNFPDQEVVVGGLLSDEGRTELCSHLKRNLDIFAWQPSDMTEKKRGQAPERTKAIQAEVEKLVEAGIMREVYYHDWLSNPVMVKKYDGSWRMCVDFTDLNKACPQDCYPLPKIDWKVESLCGYPFKCFLDAYKGYHQIQMAAADEEKTAFHTRQGVYCYTNMPFGLKNAGDGTDSSLLYKPCVTRSETKLLTDGKAGVITGLYSKKASKIFSGTSYREHNITYRPRTSIKGKILAEFLNEMPSNASQGASVAETQEEPWTLFTNGSSCVDGSGAGLILTNLDGVEFTYALRFQFASSNNEAEYEALIVDLRIATQMGPRKTT